MKACRARALTFSIKVLWRVTYDPKVIITGPYVFLTKLPPKLSRNFWTCTTAFIIYEESKRLRYLFPRQSYLASPAATKYKHCGTLRRVTQKNYQVLTLLKRHWKVSFLKVNIFRPWISLFMVLLIAFNNDFHNTVFLVLTRPHRLCFSFQSCLNN